MPGRGVEFGIYIEHGDKCIKKIVLLFNRIVIFEICAKLFYGLPTPLNFPEGEVRRSILFVLLYKGLETRLSDCCYRVSW